MKIAEQGIYFSWQGEGHLSGLPMVFVRLAGCSVGCLECDTDYRAHSALEPVEIAERCFELLAPLADRWVWVTGGEPFDRDLKPLIDALHHRNLQVAVATSGHKRGLPPVDWLSVSPHNPQQFVQSYGNEIKLVVGLNGLDPWRFLEMWPDSRTNFWFRFVQPLWNGKDVCKESVRMCLQFVKEHPNWGLSWQTHKLWQTP